MSSSSSLPVLSPNAEVVSKGDAAYDDARLLWNIEVSYNKTPQMIVYCNNTEDVTSAVRYAKDNCLPVSVRAGGHCYEDFALSDGMVIDVSRLRRYQIWKEKEEAEFGAGHTLVSVYDKLSKHDMVFPAGVCPTVGLAGFTLGGGHGNLVRALGMASDMLIGAEVVLADGRVVEANETNEHSDLLWALRGAGQMSFGVVTSFRVKAPVIPKVIYFYMQWTDWSKIFKMFDLWQRWGPNTDKRLSSRFDTFHKSHYKVSGTFVGKEDELKKLIAEFVQLEVPSEMKVTETTYIESISMTPESDSTSLDDMLSKDKLKPKDKKAYWKHRSSIVHGLMSNEAVEVVKDFMTRDFPEGLHPSLEFQAYGGAVAERKIDHSAFFHRQASMCIQYVTKWEDPTLSPIAKKVAAEEFDALDRYTNSPYRYVNYCDSRMDNPQFRYYGSNARRLSEIKGKYDADNFFKFHVDLSPQNFNPQAVLPTEEQAASISGK